jgi:dipeptide/tripeptide permease
VLVFTLAELLHARSGSVTTKLAPEAFNTQMVAPFYLSVSLRTAISGELARLYTAENEGPTSGPRRDRYRDRRPACRSLAWVLKLMRGVR